MVRPNYFVSRQGCRGARKAVFFVLLVIGLLARPASALADALNVVVEDDGSIVENWQGRRESALRAAVALGAKSVRVMVTEGKVSEDGFGDFDAAISRIRAYGLRPQITVTLGPRTRPDLWRPDRFAAFVTEVVSRYKGRSSLYGLYNEPNVTGWFPDMPLGWKASAYLPFGSPATTRRARLIPQLGS